VPSILEQIAFAAGDEVQAASYATLDLLKVFQEALTRLLSCHPKPLPPARPSGLSTTAVCVPAQPNAASVPATLRNSTVTDDIAVPVRFARLACSCILLQAVCRIFFRPKAEVRAFFFAMSC